MRFLDRSGATREIKRLVKRSSTATLAVAFWGEGAIDELGLRGRLDRPTTILCNLRTGGTNPSVIEQLLALATKASGKWTVRQDDHLHAKVYLFDDAVVLGSSNVSANGLAFEGRELSGWTEANVLIHDTAFIDGIRGWLKPLRGVQITHADIAFAVEARSRTRSSLTMPMSRGRSLLDALRNEPEMFRRVPGYLTFYDTDLSSEARDVQKRLQSELGDEVSIFEEWPDLPSTGVLVCFWHDTGSFRFEGVWERREKASDVATGTGRSIQVIWRSRGVLGLSPFTRRDREAWISLCDAVRRQHRHSDQHGWCVSLYEVARLLAQIER
jgi:hypothetical protein